MRTLITRKALRLSGSELETPWRRCCDHLLQRGTMRDMSEQGAARGDHYVTGNIAGHDITIGFMAEVAAGASLATFLRAYCAELGKRFGGSTADWISKVHVRKRVHPTEGKTALEVPVNDVVTKFEVADNDDLPDEAKLALIDLDITAEGVRGHRLMWDAKVQRWIVTG
jgi:hypothetical protein